MAASSLRLYLPPNRFHLHHLFTHICLSPYRETLLPLHHGRQGLPSRHVVAQQTLASAQRLTILSESNLSVEEPLGKHSTKGVGLFLRFIVLQKGLPLKKEAYWGHLRYQGTEQDCHDKEKYGGACHGRAPHHGQHPQPIPCETLFRLSIRGRIGGRSALTPD
jgi:hypothetical protein